MASIEKYETKTGVRYMVRYRKPDGTPTKQRGFKRKIDAVNWMAAHVTVAKATRSFVDPQAGKVTVGELHEQWMTAKSPLWKKSNRGREEKNWRLHCADRWDHMRVGDLTRPMIQEWVSGMAEEYSPGFVVNVYSSLNSVCKIAVKDRRIPHNPCEDVELPRVPKRKERRVYLTVGELLEFADSCARSRHLGSERRALVLLLGLCGLRWGEAAGLRVVDVDFDRGELHVVRNVVWLDRGWVEDTPKNHESRVVPMPHAVADALKPICESRQRPEDRVFRDYRGGPIARQSISPNGGGGWWYCALERLDWSYDRWPVPHDLRHTAASLAVHAGANVKALQRMLGHKTASMTLDVYADLFDSDLRDVASLLDAAVEIETGGKAPEEASRKRAQNVPTE